MLLSERDSVMLLKCVRSKSFVSERLNFPPLCDFRDDYGSFHSLVIPLATHFLQKLQHTSIVIYLNR